MAMAKKKSGQGKKKATKSKKTKLSVDLKTESTAISGGTMKDAFRQAFLRREV